MIWLVVVTMVAVLLYRIARYVAWVRWLRRWKADAAEQLVVVLDADDTACATSGVRNFVIIDYGDTP